MMYVLLIAVLVLILGIIFKRVFTAYLNHKDYDKAVQLKTEVELKRDTNNVIKDVNKIEKEIK